MKITDVDTGNVPHKTYEENGKFVIRLGDEDTYVTGPQQYEISYLVRIYDDKNVESDVLYYDLLPTEWETPIGACEINMKLPKPVKKSEIEIYAAAYGSDTAHENVYWSYDENKNMLRITGTELPQGTGITVYIPLEEGYWVGQLNNDWARTAGLVTMFAVPVLIVLYWLRKGRDPKLVKTVEFYPPKGMTPAEVGYFYDGNIDSRDLGAMVVYMAQKGYLRIAEKHHKLRVYPLKDPDDLEKPFVSRMYHGIFGDAPLQTGADSSGQTMPQGIAQKGVNLGKYSSSLRSAWQSAGRMLETEYSGDNAPMEQGGKLRQIGGALILNGKLQRGDGSGNHDAGSAAGRHFDGDQGEKPAYRRKKIPQRASHIRCRCVDRACLLLHEGRHRMGRRERRAGAAVLCADRDLRHLRGIHGAAQPEIRTRAGTNLRAS